VPDTSTLRELTGWVAQRTIEETIDEVIASQLRALVSEPPSAQSPPVETEPATVSAGV